MSKLNVFVETGQVQATPYERSAQRVDYANGYKDKTVLTRMGEVTFEAPQVRSGGFYPSALERGSRSEQAMNLALAEMYVQGVSTRKVIEVLQKLVGPEVSISSTQINRCTALLDTGLHAWRTRPLDETPYLIQDARYEQVRKSGRVVDCAVLVDIGVTASGHRRVLGVSVALSEAEVHWRAFLDGLIERGLRRVKFLASDDHAGLKAARKAMFPGCPGNAASSTCNAMRRAMLADSTSVRRWPARYAASLMRAMRLKPSACSTQHSRTGGSATRNWPLGPKTTCPRALPSSTCPRHHQMRMRTTNALERLNKELKRRTRVATLFPNPHSCLPLVSALLAEQDEEWMTAKIYLSMKP